MFVEFMRTTKLHVKLNVLSISEVQMGGSRLIGEPNEQQVVIRMNNNNRYLVEESYHEVSTKIEEALTKINSVPKL